ncbi:unnamed protein product, partial [Brachionus calyciflorus]
MSNVSSICFKIARDVNVHIDRRKIIKAFYERDRSMVHYLNPIDDKSAKTSKGDKETSESSSDFEGETNNVEEAYVEISQLQEEFNKKLKNGKSTANNKQASSNNKTNVSTSKLQQPKVAKNISKNEARRLNSIRKLYINNLFDKLNVIDINNDNLRSEIKTKIEKYEEERLGIEKRACEAKRNFIYQQTK